MKEYSDELIEEIKDSIDIADFIGEYVELNKKGKEYIGKCPFHDERTGSFTVTPRKGMYYCFGCKKGGDVISFCQDYLNMSYEEAISYLAGIAGISATKTVISSTVKYLKKSTKKKKQIMPEKHEILDKSILDGFERRRINKWIDEGIPQELMEKYGVMYDRRANRIVYPVYDNDGNLINIKGRTLYDNYKDLNIPKYMNYYPVGDMDYLQAFCFKKDIILEQKEIILFESLKSVMKLDSFGQYNSVSSETSELNMFQAKTIIQLHCNVVIAYDNDVTLEKLMEKEPIKMLCRFTNVHAVIDKKGLLGEIKDKNAPVDKGKRVWDELYKTKIKL